MFETAAEVTGRDVAGPVVLILLLTGSAVFVVGYAMAVMHRANKDYKSSKAGLPKQRKAYWQAWWTAVRRGTLVFLIFVCLVAYWWRSGDGDADATTPEPSKSPKAPITDRWVTRTPAVTHR
ncbi:hypothetical protein GCM10010172_19530 [Paractinoplanes ferrugineus]|uniref:Uncharacterized protein n=1 Tax=Paractinoplanes ferrugineus TaxID=113564 RepID=A0A919MDW0_9ACTN|nr:hypothetical protein [Actinoplanes ferrugineus]GIE16216.1 hypothetical protein Afe05nite_80560 [Actinoplanes ferrugineus]